MVMDELLEPSNRVAGSFRDPSGYVFRKGSRLFRTLNASSTEILRELEASGTLAELVRSKLLVGTKFVDSELRDLLSQEHDGCAEFLEHDLLETISYPYEWSVSMLADAGLLTLDLQSQLVQQGYSLKDATAYNIQFVNGRPIFIDIPSIEKPRRLDLWPALGQFNQMFTYPLMLAIGQDLPLSSYFLPHLNGMSPKQVARLVGHLRIWRPSMAIDVGLPALLSAAKFAQNTDVNKVLSKPNSNVRVQLISIKRLRKKIKKLRRRFRPDGVWTTYTKTCTYDDEAETAKKKYIEEFLQANNPEVVLDLGCNTGTYSRIAAKHGARVLSVDSDHDTVDILYRSLKSDPASVSPLIADLCNPSPGIGFRNQERPPLLDRIQADVILALALVHHLLVSGNLPLEEIRDLLADLTRIHLILEFIPNDDVMFRQLLAKRVGPFEPISLEQFIDVLSSRFQILRQQSIPHSERVLLFLEKR